MSIGRERTTLAVCLLLSSCAFAQGAGGVKSPAQLDVIASSLETQAIDEAAHVQRTAAFAALTAKARQEGQVRVIVHVAVDEIAALTADSTAARTAPLAAQADVRLADSISKGAQRETAKLVGVPHEISHIYKSIPFVAMSVSEEALRRLEASPGVLGIEEDKLAGLSLNNTVNIVGASAAWAGGLDGSGWYVAVLDTGVRATHEFFGGKDLVQACFATGEAGGDCPNGLNADITSPNAAEPYPSSWAGYDHGTHTSGIAVGNGPSVPAAGVAKGADLIHVKVFFRCTGCCGGADCLLARNSDRIAGQDYVYSLRFTHNIAAVSLSLGGGLYSEQAACDAANAADKASIDALRSAGIATVIATGNEGSCTGIQAPACISSAIAVGATNDSDVEYSGNNWHPTLADLFAPGVAVLSSVAASDTSYASFTGTSMATPHVGGAWAILRQADPSASVTEIFNALAQSGQVISGLCGAPVPQKRIQIDSAIGFLGFDACCQQDGAVCTDITAEDCRLLGGKTRPRHACGDIPSPCEEDTKFSQPASIDGEDIASNIDFSDEIPNVVVADDFTSDGRPIRALRWWGSRISPALAVTGAAGTPAPLPTASTTEQPAPHRRVPPVNAGPAPLNDVAATVDGEPAGTIAAAPTDRGYGTEHVSDTVASCALNAPQTLTLGGAHSAAPLFTAAEFGSNGDCTFMYVLDLYGSTLGRLDIVSGVHTVIGPAVPVGDESWSGLARDPTTNTMYAVSTDCAGGNQLYTIDLGTGAVSPIGNIAVAGCVISMAFDNAGVLYALDIVDDVLIRVDKATAASVVLGPVGFNASYSQGMGTDHDTDTIYLAAFNTAPQRGELRTANTTTGATTLVGVLGQVSPGGTVEVGGFAVPTGCIDLEPDGWLVSFHEPLADPGLVAPPLGLYYCDASVVDANPTQLPSCDGAVVYDYRADLAGCCLVHANADSRSLSVPAQSDGFFEERCVDYAIDIQAVIGRRFVDDGGAGCTEVATGRSIDGDFWGWHTAPDSVGAPFGLGSALASTVTVAPPDWLYGPWSAVAPVCAAPNMAFELFTDVIYDGDPDADQDGYPDSCVCGTINGAVADPSGIPQSRYVAFSAPEASGLGAKQAIQIEFIDLPEFPSWNTEKRWLGPPRQYPDEFNNQPGLTFTGVSLSCEPVFEDWGALGLLQVFGGEIVPESSYAVRIVQDCCSDLNDPSCYSVPLIINTGAWGDIWPAFRSDPGAPTQPDFTDIAAMVRKFQALPDAPIKPVAQLQPNTALPDRPIDFKDIAADVQAFVGAIPYSGSAAITGPCACPSTVTCGATTCATDGICAGGFCIGGFCRDECGRCAP